MIDKLSQDICTGISNIQDNLDDLNERKKENEK